MKRAYENGPGKNWGLGALQTSKTSSACRREHDSVVLTGSEKAWFWMLFGTPFRSLWDLPAQKTLFFRVSENHFIFHWFFNHFDSENGTKNQWKIDPLGHLAPTWLEGGVILSQHGSRGTHPRRCSLILHHFVIDSEMDFLSGCIGAHTF